jgi:hypothetical protein
LLSEGHNQFFQRGGPGVEMANLIKRDLEKITEDHIRQAALQIDVDRIPKRERARDYEVIVEEKHLPCPYLVRKAFELAYGYEPPGPKKNLGPHLALPKLRELGFDPIRRGSPYPNNIHNEPC